RREARELVVAEVALLDAGGENEVVVGDCCLAAIGSPRDDVTTLRIHADHLGHGDGRVTLFAQVLTNGVLAVTRRQHRWRELVEQGLEGVMIAAIEQKDADGRILQRLDRGESRESATYAHASRSAASRGRCCIWTHRAVSGVRLLEPALP